jgi:hypothetical protein
MKCSPNEVQNEQEDPWHHKVITSNTPSPSEHDNAWHGDRQPLLLAALTQS